MKLVTVVFGKSPFHSHQNLDKGLEGEERDPHLCANEGIVLTIPSRTKEH